MMPSCSERHGVVWRIAATRKGEKEEQKKRGVKTKRTLSLVIGGCKECLMGAEAQM